MRNIASRPQSRTRTGSFRTWSRNLVNNPHIVSTYFSAKHRVLRDTALQHFDLVGHARVDVLLVPASNGRLADPDLVSPPPHSRSTLMTARLFRAHTRLPPVRWCPRRQQRRLVRHCSVRKHARLLLSLDYCFPSLCHKRGSCRFHYPCTDLAYVGDAESGSGRHFSPLARTRGSIITPMGPVGMEDQSTKVDLTRLRSRRRDNGNYASKLETVSDGYHHAWTTCAPTCLKTSPPTTRFGASGLFRTTGPSPPARRPSH